MDASDIDKNTRKRLRVPVSCRACRKRKTKCDRARPQCGYCNKSLLDCVYDDAKSWLSPGIENKGSPNSSNDSAYINQLEMELLKLRHKILKIESSLDLDLDDSGRKIAKVGVTNSNPYSLPPDHPFISTTDTIDFYMRDKTQSSFTGTLGVTAFSWRTMVKKDPFIKLLWLKLVASGERRAIMMAMRKSRNIPDLSTVGLSGASGAINPLPIKTQFQEEGKNAYKLDLNYTLVARSLTRENLYSAAEKDDVLRSVSESIEVSYNPNYSKWRLTIQRPTTHDQLVEMILDKLPHKKVVWLLMDRFFKYVYPFMPFIDEQSFLKKITKIIGERSSSNNKITELKIENKYEIALLGILLFILEFASFTLFSNSKNEMKKDKDLEYLLKYPLAQDNAALAKYCFVQFKFFRHVSLEILQLAIFKRLYMKYSPQEGDGTDANESQIFNGLILQMAVSLGLNRDSDLLVNGNPQSQDFMEAPAIPEKLANLKRKIWHFILKNDSYHTYVLSGSSSTRIDFYDTALPHRPTDANRASRDMDIENFIYESFQQHAKYDLIVKSFIYDMLSFDVSNVKSILLRLHHLEDEIATDYKDFHYILFKKYASGNGHIDGLRKVFTTIQYIELKSFIYLVYYHIFLHYEANEANDEVAFYYLKKAFQISAELLGGLVHFFTKSEQYFGQGLDYLLTPTLELMFHKVIHLSYGFQYRLKQYQFECKFNVPENNVDHKVEILVKRLHQSYIKSVKTLLTITDRYYYAWKICKFQRICMILLLSSFEAIPKVGQNSRQGGCPVVIEPPPKSLLLRLDHKKLIEFFDFVEDSIDSDKIDKVFDPNYEDQVDHMIFSYGYDMGHYLKRSSERNKPLKVDEISPESFDSPNYVPFANLPMDPKIDKWWVDFVNQKSTSQYSDIYGKVFPENTDYSSGGVNNKGEKRADNTNSTDFINTAGSSYDLFSETSDIQENLENNPIGMLFGLDSTEGLGSLNWNDFLKYLSDESCIGDN